MNDSGESLRELLTLDELTNRVGMSVRNIRFYTTKGLVPPPIRRGRSGYYSADHVARLELVQELQAHGFTLSAIEKYVAGDGLREVGQPWRQQRALERDVGRRGARRKLLEIALDRRQREPVRLELAHQLEAGQVVGPVEPVAPLTQRRGDEAATRVEADRPDGHPDPLRELLDRHPVGR
jgi:DNA-binding transcriptional MerR regulator